jgi:mono/diheme cytochrome c family protein
MKPTAKKVLKYLGFTILGLLLLIGGTALFINIRGIPKYDVQKIDLKVEVTPERIAHGKRLATMLCAGCHLNPTTQVLTGKFLSEAPPEFGKIYSRNITRDPQKGIGTWTDGELAYLLRTGIKRDGNFVIPMGGFIRMSDEDILSIIAFLHSDDPLVQPAKVDDYDSDYTLLGKFLGTFVIKPNEYPKHPINAPSITDKVAYGKYLALGVLDCYTCHSADFKTNDSHHPEQSADFFGGGNPLRDPNGKIVYSRNITPDPEHGIGKWTEEEFIRAIKEGFRPDNTPLRMPMERVPELTNDEASALYAYLKTVPALKKQNQQSEIIQVAATADMPAGKGVYYKYSCYSCHGETGVGTCDLRQAYKKYPSDSSLIAWIRDPSKQKPDSKMPTWNGVIREEEFAPLAQYVRYLGEHAKPEEQVATK